MSSSFDLPILVHAMSSYCIPAVPTRMRIFLAGRRHMQHLFRVAGGDGPVARQAPATVTVERECG